MGRSVTASGNALHRHVSQYVSIHLIISKIYIADSAGQHAKQWACRMPLYPFDTPQKRFHVNTALMTLSGMPI
jgi:hypothetical protein